jgi:flagellar assembly factor FliW
MNRVEQTESPALPVPADNKIHMPMGLLGFERIKEYFLMADPAEEPFLWLQVPDDSKLAFLVVAARPLLPSYKPEISREDLTSIGLANADDASILCIVTVRGPNQATLNLKGPILLNRSTFTAKQVIPVNASEYSVQHPLPTVQP